MHAKKKTLFLFALIAGALALTGCTAMEKPSASPTPMAQPQQTAQPATAEPVPEETISATAAPQEEIKSVTLLIGGQEVQADALIEQGKLLLPLTETGEALGWKAQSEQTEEEAQTRRIITLEKDESRITVSWTVSDNTAKNISWQKDGLLIPVDASLTTMDNTVYVPAAFFEMAVDARITKNETNVIVSTPKPNDTPKMTEDSTGKNG